MLAFGGAATPRTVTPARAAQLGRYAAHRDFGVLRVVALMGFALVVSSCREPRPISRDDTAHPTSSVSSASASISDSGFNMLRSDVATESPQAVYGSKVPDVRRVRVRAGSDSARDSVSKATAPLVRFTLRHCYIKNGLALDSLLNGRVRVAVRMDSAAHRIVTVASRSSSWRGPAADSVATCVIHELNQMRLPHASYQGDWLLDLRPAA